MVGGEAAPQVDLPMTGPGVEGQRRGRRGVGVGVGVCSVARPVLPPRVPCSCLTTTRPGELIAHPFRTFLPPASPPPCIALLPMPQPRPAWPDIHRPLPLPCLWEILQDRQARGGARRIEAWRRRRAAGRSRGRGLGCCVSKLRLPALPPLHDRRRTGPSPARLAGAKGSGRQGHWGRLAVVGVGLQAQSLKLTRGLGSGTAG